MNYNALHNLCDKYRKRHAELVEMCKQDRPFRVSNGNEYIYFETEDQAQEYCSENGVYDYEKYDSNAIGWFSYGLMLF